LGLKEIEVLGASPERDRFSPVRKLSSRELPFGFEG